MGRGQRGRDNGGGDGESDEMITAVEEGRQFSC
jgi:hypothetical protein